MVCSRDVVTAYQPWPRWAVREFDMRITFVPDSGVGTLAVTEADDLSPADCAAKLRELHEEEAWEGELQYPAYAALHYAGLAAIEQVANEQLGYHVVPVRFGVYVVT